MMAAARMFGANCFFTDRKNISQAASRLALPEPIRIITRADIEQYDLVVALENTADANDIYGFRLPDCARVALVAGNERFGVSQELLRRSTHRVQIPMFSHSINTLNVSAASAVASYYLANDLRSRLLRVANPGARRPDLLLLGGRSHVEIGSTIRSAAAFGWNKVYLSDRHNVWFKCDRAIRAEGRGAARRGRNPICVRPVSEIPPTDNVNCAAVGDLAIRSQRLQYERISVVTSHQIGALPLSKSNLALGRRQLLVIPDESCVDVRLEDWNRFGKQVEFVQIETPNDFPFANYDYHYRLPASIAMAECARQVGTR
jgi:hypothetical protein